MFSDKAKEQIEQVLKQHQGKKLKLVYDTEGLGCSTDGVPAFQLVNEVDKRDEKIMTNISALYIERKEKMYFDEQMTVDWNSEKNSFSLKSPQQIFHSRMHIVVT